MNKSCILFSGGPDSLAALEIARTESEIVALVHFPMPSPSASYKAALALAFYYELPLVTIPWIGILPSGYFEPLKDRIPYLADRNLLFLTLSSIHIKSHHPDVSRLYTGFSLCGREEEGTASYDISGKFVRGVNALLEQDWTHKLLVKAPYADRSKVTLLGDLLYRFYSPLHLTYSCYREELAVSCGECSNCRHRIESFQELRVQDPIPYAVSIDWSRCLPWEEYRDAVAQTSPIRD